MAANAPSWRQLCTVLSVPLGLSLEVAGQDHAVQRSSLLGCSQEPRQQSGLKANEQPLPGDGEAGTLAVLLHNPSGYWGVREVCVWGTSPPDVGPSWPEHSPGSVSLPAVARANILHCERSVAIPYLLGALFGIIIIGIIQDLSYECFGLVSTGLWGKQVEGMRNSSAKAAPRKWFTAMPRMLFRRILPLGSSWLTKLV